MIFNDEDIICDVNKKLTYDWIDDNITTLSFDLDNIYEYLNIEQENDVFIIKSKIYLYIQAAFTPYYIKLISNPGKLIFVTNAGAPIYLNSLTKGTHKSISCGCSNTADIIWPYEDMIIESLSISNKFDLNANIPQNVKVKKLNLRNVKSIDYIDINKYEDINCDKVSGEVLTNYILHKQNFKGKFKII